MIPFIFENSVSLRKKLKNTENCCYLVKVTPTIFLFFLQTNIFDTLPSFINLQLTRYGNPLFTKIIIILVRGRQILISRVFIEKEVPLNIILCPITDNSFLRYQPFCCQIEQSTCSFLMKPLTFLNIC